MKGSITKRLILYFACTLLVFAIIIGLVFTILFTNTMTKHSKTDLEKHAGSIASTLSSFLEGNTLSSREKRTGQGKGNGNGQGGFGAFLELVNDMAIGKVWFVDKDTSLITKTHHSSTVTIETMPPDGDRLIQNALKGEVGFSESFSEAVGVKSITVCVPAYGSDGSVLAAVLLHAPVEGMHESIQSGLSILAISLVIALVLSVFIAILLSKRFIHPIKTINHTAKILVNGDYSPKTDIHQNDEIGELAGTMDVLSDQLLSARKQREQLEIERQMFYADISHELRTPLTVMCGSLEALKEGKIKDGEKQQEYYELMLAEAAYMQNMINDLLDLSKLKNPDYSFKKERLNLSDILSDAVRSVRRIAEKKHIQIEYENPMQMMEMQGNYEKIRQMFLIVLDNAIKFSPTNDLISIKVNRDENHYMISICDHGKGIKKTDLPHIFERFYKDNSNTNRQGTGIGLAIAKHIADRHHVEIKVNSEINQGTCFIFFIRIMENEKQK